MSNSLKYLLTWVFGILLFFFIAKNLGSKEIIKAFHFIFSLQGFILFLITISIVLVSILKRSYIYKNFGIKLSFKENIKTWLINFALDYFTPVSLTGGEIPTILLLQKKYNVEPVNSTSGILIDKILNGTISFISILIGIIVFALYYTFSSRIIFYFIIFIVIFLLSLLVIFYSKMLKRESLLKWLFQKLKISEIFDKSKNANFIFLVEENLINFFDIKKISFWKGFLLALLREILLIFKTGILITFLAGGLELQKVFIIYALINLAAIFPTPAALGSFELMSLIGFSSLNLGSGTSLTFAMAQRFLDVLVALFGLIFFILNILDILKENIFNFLNKILK